jgi:DNA helicase-2/ATP-dependent DNA helicase PcrA
MYFCQENYMPANEKQLQAIESPVNSNIRIFAPPGSGKTYTIEQRYKFMVDNGIDPKSILVVTFSKNMADEMGQRIKNTCPSAVLEQISTIHAFCYRLLTRWDENSLYYNWQVPKDWEVKKTLVDLIEEIWADEEKPGYKEVLHWIDGSKYNGISANESRPFFSRNLGVKYGDWLFQIRKRFDGWLKSKKALLFSDMLFLTEYQLKINESFKAKCRAKFPYVIIDEAQDTNAQAMRILISFAQYSMTVSDVDQMLYRFQGAKPEIVAGDYVSKIQTIKLDKNYRSTDEIIDACQKLIAYNYSDLGGPYNQEFMKDVSGIKGQGSPLSFQFVETIEDESNLVANTILEQVQQGYAFGDFFIGARTRAQLGYLETALVKTDVKFINIAGGSFWQSKHVSEVVSYLKLAHKPEDSEAFKKVYNIASAFNKDKSGKYLHHRWLGQEFLRITNESYLNVWDAPRFNKRYYYGVKDLTDFVSDIKIELVHAENIGDVIKFIIENCYKQYLASDEGLLSGDEAENGKLDELETVIELAAEYKTPTEFIAYVDGMIKQAEDNKNKDWSEYTILSTYHRLKGLERKVMIATGLSEGVDGKTEQPRGLLPHTFSLVEPPQFGILPTGHMSPVADERCILFVGISRAKERCFITGCSQYRTWKMQPSRFIQELGLLVIEKK